MIIWSKISFFSVNGLKAAELGLVNPQCGETLQSCTCVLECGQGMVGGGCSKQYISQIVTNRTRLFTSNRCLDRNLLLFLVLNVGITYHR